MTGKILFGREDRARLKAMLRGCYLQSVAYGDQGELTRVLQVLRLHGCHIQQEGREFAS
jgi:hypothetical protein